jgi:hypothetical protein
MFHPVDRYSNLPCLAQSILRATFFETQNLFHEYHAHIQGKWELPMRKKYVCISLSTPTITFEMNSRWREFFAHNGATMTTIDTWFCIK